MAGWRSNPIVGVVAVILILVSAYFVWRQISGGGTESEMLNLMDYQARMVAEETAKFMPEGGKVCVIVAKGEGGTATLDRFKKTLGDATNLQVVAFEFDVPEMDEDGAPTEFALQPELASIMSMSAAVKEHADAKCMVTFLGLSYTPTIAERGIPSGIVDYFRQGGKAVVLGGEIGSMPGARDPFMALVKEGKIRIWAAKPQFDRPPSDILSMPPKDYVDRFYMLVTKDNAAEYEALVQKGARR